MVSGRQFLKGILKVIQETFYEQYPMALFSNGFVKVTKKPFKNRFMLPIKERFMNVSIWFRNGFFYEPIKNVYEAFLIGLQKTVHKRFFTERFFKGFYTLSIKPFSIGYK